MWINLSEILRIMTSEIFHYQKLVNIIVYFLVSLKSTLNPCVKP